MLRWSRDLPFRSASWYRRSRDHLNTRQHEYGTARGKGSREEKRASKGAKPPDRPYGAYGITACQVCKYLPTPEITDRMIGYDADCARSLAFNKYLGVSLILGQCDTLELWLPHRYQCRSIPSYNSRPSITFSIFPKKVRICILCTHKIGRSRKCRFQKPMVY